jgi:hypothetical protein
MKCMDSVLLYLPLSLSLPPSLPPSSLTPSSSLPPFLYDIKLLEVDWEVM